jgi:predicted AAA+ superfamily ATPase
MVYIPQKQIENLNSYLVLGKVVIIYGARRTGKTTLIQHYLESVTDKYLLVTGDDILVRQYLESQSLQTLKDFIGSHSLLVVDEAQNVRQIGHNLKLIIDNIPNIRIIATGSSSFDLARDIGEPLTGRKYTLKLFPISQLELSSIENRLQTQSNLESRLVYGSYPEVILMESNRQRAEYLRELVNAYLFKDILIFEGIKQSEKLLRLLQLLAFQIGKEVSLNELGQQLGMSKNTVERYLDLLEKVFIIFRRIGFNRNLRKEISKNHRYYFLDVGIRNTLIDNLNPLTMRNDLGCLWENYIVVERLKRQEYLREGGSAYFWRTYDRKEIDLVEETSGKLRGYELKWKQQIVKPPSDWTRAYPESRFDVIHKDNYLDFIT